MKKIAIVIPCYNEEESLSHLIEALIEVRQGLRDKYQVDIFLINDGSIDRTQNVIADLARRHTFVYYREFASNAGHQAALRAGLSAVISYDAAVMMDADMQHPPQAIPQMLDAWSKGPKIVQMIRDDTAKQAGIFKFMTSKGYYKLINSLSNLNLDYGASDFRLIDQIVVKAISQSKENDLFLRGYFSWLPVKKTFINYKPNKRIAGQSKYSLRKMLNLAYAGILQFSEKPLLISMLIGTILAAISFLYGASLIIGYFLGDYAVSGWTSLMVTMLFLFGINFIMIGIIGTYLAHSIRLQKQRPEFIINEEKLPG